MNKQKSFLIYSIAMIMLFTTLQAKATIYTIGNDTLHYLNANYYFIGNNDTVLIDTTVITVDFVSNTPLSSINAFEMNYNLTLRTSLSSGENQYLTPIGRNFAELGDSIVNDPCVNKMDIHYFMTLFSFEPEDNYISEQWYLKNIGVYDGNTLEGVWNITKGSSDVVIAVLDSGVDWDEEEFGPKDTDIDAIYLNPGEDEWEPWDNENSGDDIDNDGNGYVDDLRGWDFDHVDFLGNCQTDVSMDNDPASHTVFHGNAVAGIIAAKTNNDEGVAGIAGGDVGNNNTGCKILPVKVNDKFQYFFYTNCIVTPNHYPTSAIQEAIIYATDMGADVINMSFGIIQSPKPWDNLDSQIEYAHANGVTLVASAGNGGYLGRVGYPAKRGKVIAVGATDEDDNRWSESSHGQYLEISAPGENITALRNGDGGVFDDQLDGTSFSAAMVSATVGLMISVNPTLTNGSLTEDGSIRNILKRTADKTGTWGYYPPNDENGWNEWLGYGRLNTYEAVCMAIDYKPEIVVQDDDTWTERVISKENIVLEAGKNLTIKGEVLMGKDARIIVKQGATLTVDGGIITNMPFCGKEDEMWAGIEVWGDLDDSQFEYAGHPLAQGKLVLNDATIENAIVAVRLFKYADFNTTGGVVFAKNTIFKNNRRAISIFPYKNILDINGIEYDYQAGFSNCTFTVDSDYLGPNSYNGEHMMLYGVKGIGVGGCIFENKLDNTPSGNAIHSADAGFVIKGACKVNDISPCPTDQYQNTTFNGFYQAIRSVNSANALYSIAIRKAEFSNNGFGIHFSSVNDAVVVGNKFELGMYEDCDYDAGTGIFLDNCKRFAIEDNRFKLLQNAPPAHYVGIHTLNTNNAFDEFYKNDFDDMIVANHAEGKNWWGEEEHDGLAYYCNTNQNNSWDFYVHHVTGDLYDGIQELQGNRDYVAGNTFSQLATGHFDNWGSYEIEYYYDQASPAEVPSKLYRVEPNPELLENTCPNHYEGGDILLSTAAYQQRESDYNSALSSYNMAYNLYNSTNDSARKRMYEEQMSHYNMLLSRAVYDIVRSDLADTLVQDDKFITWQEELNTYAAAESVVDLYMQQGDYVTAMNKVDSLQINFVFDAYDSLEYPYYQNLKSLQATWMDQGRTVFELTASEINSLSAIADSSRGVAGAQARGILAFAYDSIYSFSSCAQIPDTTQKSAKFSGDSNNEEGGLFVSAEPNPANNSVTFAFTLPDNVESTLLSLYNANGGLIDKLVLNKSTSKIKYNCSHLKAGIYYYSVSCLNEQMTGKLIIVR